MSSPWSSQFGARPQLLSPSVNLQPSRFLNKWSCKQSKGSTHDCTQSCITRDNYHLLPAKDNQLAPSQEGQARGCHCSCKHKVQVGNNRSHKQSYKALHNSLTYLERRCQQRKSRLLGLSHLTSLFGWALWKSVGLGCLCLLKSLESLYLLACLIERAPFLSWVLLNKLIRAGLLSEKLVHRDRVDQRSRL